jgi:hypothetical protein
MMASFTFEDGDRFAFKLLEGIVSMLCLISAAITATNEIGGNYKPDMNGCYF